MAKLKWLMALGLMFCAVSAPAAPDAATNITDFPSPPQSRPQAIVSGPDGAIWYGTATRICRLTMDGKISEFKLPNNLTSAVGGTVVQSLVFGKDGNLWGAYNQGNAIWRMTPTGQFTDFTIPTPKAWPRDIALGPDGNVWFTEFTGNKITKITTKGEFTEYPIPTEKSGSYSLAVGPDGNIWFAEYYTQKIGKISMAGEITEIPTPKHDKVGPLGGPNAPRGPRCIAKGPDGNLWFTEWKANKIGRITPKGEITEFDIPTVGSGPIGISAGPDGNIWYCANKGHRIGCVTPAGQITELQLHSNSEPFLITGGPDGNIWFTDEADCVGRINIAAEPEGPEKK